MLLSEAIWRTDCKFNRRTRTCLVVALSACFDRDKRVVSLGEIQELGDFTRKMMKRELSKMIKHDKDDRLIQVFDADWHGFKFSFSEEVGKSSELEVKITRFYSKSDYDLYLHTDGWKGKATRCRRRFNYQCCLCGDSESTIHAHHRTYKRLGFETDNDLIALCESCHNQFHQKSDLSEGSS